MICNGVFEWVKFFYDVNGCDVTDQLNNMDFTKEMDRLQKDRAIGPPKHKKQVASCSLLVFVILPLNWFFSWKQSMNTIWIFLRTVYLNIIFWQVSDLYKEIQIILADCLFCLATQQPLGKADTMRLIQHLRADNSMNADGSLEPVSLCLLMTLLYCFDVTLLDQEDSRGQSLITEVCYVWKGTQLLVPCN